jgi:hypothetical protein
MLVQLEGDLRENMEVLDITNKTKREKFFELRCSLRLYGNEHFL